MGKVKEAMLEHRMVQKPMVGANDNLIIKHWSEEIRNSMYQLNDEELVAFLEANVVEAERLRVCMRIADGSPDGDADEKEV